MTDRPAVDRDRLVERLERAGFVAAEEDADDLLRASAGDPERLAALVERRLTGEPLAWITGEVGFGGRTVRIDPGVYVPRWHTEELARRAAARLPDAGVAIDACTGSGAVAAALAAARPGARVLASDLDPTAVACARTNGVDARTGDLLAPFGPAFDGAVDLVVAVVPYVPTGALGTLQRDTFAFEDRRAYDGGGDGTDLHRRLAAEARRVLRPGGWLVLELGGEQDRVLAPVLDRLGYRDLGVWADEEGDPRGIEGRLGA